MCSLHLYSYPLEKKFQLQTQTFSFHFIPICLYLAIFFHCVNQQTKRVVRSPQLAQAISVFLCPSYVPAKCCSYQLLQGHRISVVRSRSMTEKKFKETTKTSVIAQSYGLACMTEICLKKPKCVCQTQQVRTRELKRLKNRPLGKFSISSRGDCTEKLTSRKQTYRTYIYRTNSAISFQRIDS